MAQTLYDAYGNFYNGYSYEAKTLPSDDFGDTRDTEWEFDFSTSNPYLTNAINGSFHDLPYWFFNTSVDIPNGNYYLESYRYANTDTWQTLKAKVTTSLKILFKVTLGGVPLSGVAFGGTETDVNGEVFLNVSSSSYSGTWTPVLEGYSFDPVSVVYDELDKCAIDTFAATDERPSKATTPAPANAATDVTLDQATLTWVDGGGADTYNVYYGDTSGDLSLVSSTQAGLSFTVTGITNGSPYNYLITRYWRIDSVNAAGTTTGDEWSFTTMRFSAPAQTYWSSEGGYYYRLLIDTDGDYGDHPIDGGVEDTDYEVLAGYLPNFISTTRKLVGVANSKVWIEDL